MSMDENLTFDEIRCSKWPSSLPAIEELCDVLGRGVLELLVPLRVEQVTARVENGKRGHAFGDGDVILPGDIEVFVHVADIDVDDEIVLIEKLRVSALMVVDVEDLAVAAPVTTEIEENTLVLAAGMNEGCGNIGTRVGGL
jgi:hypothetical protein